MSELRLSIEPDIRRAELPPAWLYADAGVHAQLLERVFARSWHYAADAGDLPAPGHAEPFEFLPGALAEPLLWTRDEHARLRCLSNVCTHRANLVARAPCKQLRCRYHGRRFALDGRLLASPEFEGALDFPSPADDLRAAHAAVLGPLAFAAFDVPCAFEDWLGSLRTRLAGLPLERAQRLRTRDRVFELRANWALYVDNFLEGFHIPYVHAGLNEAIEYDSYRTLLEPWGSLQIAQARGGPTLVAPAGCAEHGQPIAAWYWWLFPATMINVYPWGLSLNVVEPLAVDRTRVRFQSYVWDASKLEQGAGAELDTVEREDEEIVEAVQRGVRARLFRRGRYSPARETGTHHFHRLLARQLAQPGAS